jgi:hypothetical protein
MGRRLAARRTGAGPRSLLCACAARSAVARAGPPIVDTDALRLESPLNRDLVRPPVDLAFDPDPLSQAQRGPARSRQHRGLDWRGYVPDARDRREGLLDIQQVHRNRAATGIEPRYGLSLTRWLRLQFLFGELLCCPLMLAVMLAMVMPAVMLAMMLRLRGRRGLGRGRGRNRRCGRLLRNTDTDPAAQKCDGYASD